MSLPSGSFFEFDEHVSAVLPFGSGVGVVFHSCRQSLQFALMPGPQAISRGGWDLPVGLVVEILVSLFFLDSVHRWAWLSCDSQCTGESVHEVSVDLAALSLTEYAMPVSELCHQLG